MSNEYVFIIVPCNRNQTLYHPGMQTRQTLRNKGSIQVHINGKVLKVWLRVHATKNYIIYHMSEKLLVHINLWLKLGCLHNQGKLSIQPNQVVVDKFAHLTVAIYLGIQEHIQLQLLCIRERDIPCFPFLFWFWFHVLLSQRWASYRPVHLCLLTSQSQFYINVYKHIR